MQKGNLIVKMKNLISTKREEIKNKHRGGAEGVSVCLEVTKLMDQVVREIYREGRGHRAAPLVLLALGSYGRCELSPYSDIDLMFVYQGEPSSVEEVVKRTVQSLWDVGLEVGHSFRSITECVQIAHDDPNTKASFLELRRIIGDDRILRQLEKTLEQEVVFADYQDFLNSKLQEMGDRHRRYGNSVRLLEPNIKESAGGLRDLHSLFWIFTANPSWHTSYKIKRRVSSTCVEFIAKLLRRDIIIPSERARLVQAFNFLLRVRNELGFLLQGKTDRLEFELQRKVAETLGYSPLGALQAVERFMRDYYLHARDILILTGRIQRAFSRKRGFLKKGERIDEGILLTDEGIGLERVSEDFFREDRVRLLKIFQLRQQYGAKFDPSLWELIERCRDLIDDGFRNSKAAAEAFLSILKGRGNVADTLRAMHELGILGRYIPEFGQLTALAQYDYYHYYTVDEHSLIAVERLEELGRVQNRENLTLSQLFSEVREKEVLYLAALLHDIGKIKGGDHPQQGAQIAEGILSRLRLDHQKKETLLFLIRNHLRMEQIAFRRNFEDPATIREFSRLVGDRDRLRLLYLLSYADLSALNPSVWTQWKGALLWELYSLTCRRLEGRPITFRIDKKEIAELKSRVSDLLPADFPRERIEKHLNLMDMGYLISFDEREIAGHLKMIEELENKIVTVGFRDFDVHWEVTVVTRDKPFLLAEICGVIAVNDLNIFSAKIFTRGDGIIVDNFRVTPVIEGEVLDENKTEDFLRDMEGVLSGRESLEELFVRHKRRWRRRRVKSACGESQVVFDNDSSDNFTIIDVFTTDSVGLLYRIARTLSELGLDIHSARIGTRVDRVADCFYVRERSGGKVLKKEKQEAIKKRLLEVVESS